MSAYDEQTKCLYPLLQSILANNDIGYSHIQSNYNDAVAVGAMVDDETVQLSANQNPTKLTTFQKWGHSDEAATSMYNAQKMYSKMRFDENAVIASDEVSKTSGFSMKTRPMTKATDYTVQMFENASFSNVAGIANLQKGQAVEYYTYFSPSRSGKHTFSVLSMDVFFLWISNDNAIYDYTPSNADISKSQLNTTTGANSFDIMLTKGEYYALRIHLFNGAQDVTSPVEVYNNGNSVFADKGEHIYFNLLNNGNYNRRLMYYALYKPSMQSVNFKCDFIQFTPANYSNIKRLKTNQPLIYRKLVIPTPITYESYIYTNMAANNTKMQLECPTGGKITIVNATWGTGDITLNEPTYETREHTDPSIIIDKNTTTYTWTTPNDDTIEQEDKVVDGICFRKYKGNLGINSSKYASKTPINAKDNGTAYETTLNIDHTDIDNSMFFTAFINSRINAGRWNGNGGVWGFEIITNANQKAKLIIKDGNGNEMYQMTSNGGTKNTGWDKIGLPNLALKNYYYFELYVEPGSVKMTTIRWDKGTSRGWHYNPYKRLTFKEAYNDPRFFSTTHVNVKITRIPKPDTVNTANITTQSYIRPVPSFQVEVPNYVTYAGNVDITQQIQAIIDTNAPTNANNKDVYTLDGKYDAIYTKLLPNSVAIAQPNKELTVAYKYEIDLTGNNVQDKKVLVNNTGQFVISYKYNGEISEYPIAPALNQNQTCPDPENCNYTLTLEDDCVLSTNSGGGTVVSRDLRTDLTQELTNIGLTMDDVVSNARWKNDPVNIYSTMNNGDILTNDFIEMEAPLKRLSSIRSDNGKYKLAFEGDDLCIYYCIRAFSTSNDVNYTSNVHSKDPVQYFFLYRPLANPLAGKVVSTLTNASTGDNSITVVPFSHTNILKDAEPVKTANQFPVLCNSQTDTCDSAINYAALTNPVDNYNNNFASKYFMLDVTSEEECANYCLSEPDCQHFFHINTQSGGQKCLRDAVGNPNPLTTNVNPDPENISTSTINTRSYMIDSTCKQGTKDMTQNTQNEFTNYQVLYGDVPSNDANKTFICGNDKFNDVANYIDAFFRGDTPYETRPAWIEAECNPKEGFTSTRVYEAFDEPCGTADCLTDRLDDLANNQIAQYQMQQTNVGELADQINAQYAILGANVTTNNVNTLDTQFNKEIPSKFSKTLPARPTTTVDDAREKDSKNIAVYENTLYTVATLSAATILITTIILMRD